mgnify:CR=1 FL=1
MSSAAKSTKTAVSRLFDRIYPVVELAYAPADLVLQPVEQMSSQLGFDILFAVSANTIHATV